jgi:uncharacterized protein YdiU (UPF0061 family)
VGTFNYASAYGTREDVQALADYSLRRHFPELESREDKYTLLLRGVAERQASLIAKWQLTGFIHGVMNTDNMAVSGETIDFGPCAFMDAYDPDTVFSSIDTEGRYAYKNQPKMGAWNLSRFAESLLPLLHDDEGEAVKSAKREIGHYWECHNASWLSGMRAKLGLTQGNEDDTLRIAEFLDGMEREGLDYTNAFRPLSDRNPAVIPRNHRVEEALAAAGRGDFSVLHDLLAALRRPYAESEIYSQPPEASCCGYRTFCGT